MFEENPFTRSELKRYKRHFNLPNFGFEAQKKLKSAKVICVGAGGLGSPVQMYLAAAGVGTLGIIDFDVVDETNLQRQIIHTSRSIGTPKVDSAFATIRSINPHIDVKTYNEKLTDANASAIISQYDVVIDGTDNFATRYLVNDACFINKKINIHASILQFEGQITVFAHPKTACYRCIYPAPPPDGVIPSCAEGGVLGVLPGLLGTMQALEAVKVITGIGDPLFNKLLNVNTLDHSYTRLNIRKNPKCPLCSKHPAITSVQEYASSCKVKSEPESSIDRKMISSNELNRILLDSQKVNLIDVRDEHEFYYSSIPGAKNIPLRKLKDNMPTISNASLVVVYCLSGFRSGKAYDELTSLGIDNVHSLEGGIKSWAKYVDTEFEYL